MGHFWHFLSEFRQSLSIWLEIFRETAPYKVACVAHKSRCFTNQQYLKRWHSFKKIIFIKFDQRLFFASFWLFLSPNSCKCGLNQFDLVRVLHATCESWSHQIFCNSGTPWKKWFFKRLLHFQVKFIPWRWRHNKSLIPKLAFRILL